jgi:hypothetical protein
MFAGRFCGPCQTVIWLTWRYGCRAGRGGRSPGRLRDFFDVIPEYLGERRDGGTHDDHTCLRRRREPGRLLVVFTQHSHMVAVSRASARASAVVTQILQA